jgi:hypothetical protein
MSLTKISQNSSGLNFDLSWESGGKPFDALCGAIPVPGRLHRVPLYRDRLADLGHR